MTKDGIFRCPITGQLYAKNMKAWIRYMNKKAQENKEEKSQKNEDNR